MENKQLNRIKVVLVEKRRTGVWLAEQLGVSPVTIREVIGTGTLVRYLSRISGTCPYDSQGYALS